MREDMVKADVGMSELLYAGGVPRVPECTA